MSAPEPAQVDEYINATLVGEDDALAAAREHSQASGLPPIEVAPSHGKLLHLLARLVGARRILEVGTLGGYSTIWLARALPDNGRLITLEINPDHAAVARHNLERAGVADRVEIRLAPAIESLTALVAEQPEPFDLVFIDADKPGNPGYLDAALSLTRPGSVIVVDNVVRHGAVADADSDNPAVIGSRAALAALGQDDRVDATAVQTLTGKGWDGLAIAVVR